ncbi:SDR family oxidoreductase [Actinoplanes sp. N902-109]|uniref:SDR family oxidoreductase n=1 Tax=Actinoplanes sp. (strain N902-109) TaxID=649831 RepID=UPI0003295BA4|nr:SDR family oxidoreductase [Actinoplanes sp. N902-109]AGL20707.1 serine 3-dehydrogenase [Actinoplanes sp. N902-109]
MTSLQNRIAVVTGASSGIGAATATTLAAAGAKVAALARRVDRLTTLDALPLAVDVRDPAALGAAADRVRTELGRPDLVVANAGVMLAAPFEKADPAELDAMIGTNVTGLVHTARAFIDDLLAAAADGRPADLVLVGSVAGHQVFLNYAVYDATKAAVAHLARNLRAELGPRGVRVRTVEPGVVTTELGDGMRDTGLRTALADWRDSMETLRSEDIAAGIAWSAGVPPRLNVAELIMVPTAQG